MAEAPDRERVKARVDALCRSFLRLSLALAWGWKGLAALSLIVSPIAFYLSGEAGSHSTPAISPPFWSALSSGLGFTVLIAILAYALSQTLGSWPTSRTADRLNRLYPIGRERDLALSLLQQRQEEVTGEKAASMTRLLAELGGGVPPEVEGAPEAQLAEALETLAAGRGAATEFNCVFPGGTAREEAVALLRERCREGREPGRAARRCLRALYLPLEEPREKAEPSPAEVPSPARVPALDLSPPGPELRPARRPRSPAGTIPIEVSPRAKTPPTSREPAPVPLPLLPEAAQGGENE